MNLIKLANHTVDLDLLPYAPLVLDVGCRGFDFTTEVLRHRHWSSIIAMDPYLSSSDKGKTMLDTRFIELHEALVAQHQPPTALMAHHSTGEGDFLTEEVPWYAERKAVLCVSLPTLMRRYGIKFWDLVKLDCEGSEYGILENWPGPVAQQISVEFHDHTGPWKEYADGDYYERLFSCALKDYEVVQHNVSQQGTGCGHWDTLLRLR